MGSLSKGPLPGHDIDLKEFSQYHVFFCKVPVELSYKVPGTLGLRILSCLV